MKNKRKQKIRGQQITIKKQMLKNQGKAHCEFCGNDKEAILQIHHIKPVSQGGDNKDSNLVILCPNCHKLAHAHLISVEELKTAKKMKKVFVSPEEIQKNVEKLKQIETVLKSSIKENTAKNQELVNSYRQSCTEYIDKMQEYHNFMYKRSDLKTKVQLCHYINRLEQKYQTLKDEYTQLSREYKNLKSESNNLELQLNYFQQQTEKPYKQSLRVISHFFKEVFFGIS